MKDFININNDLVIANGKFAIDDSLHQHVSDILESAPGNYKQSPLLGCDVTNLINGSNTSVEVERAIRLQMLQDGISVAEVSLRNNELIVNIDE